MRHSIDLTSVVKRVRRRHISVLELEVRELQGSSNSSPAFSLNAVPKGTTTLQFRMVDLQVPNYNYGVGTVPYKSEPTVACGSLNNYSPPSPSSGGHSYQITVTAFGPGNTNLGSATFTREFPEKK